MGKEAVTKITVMAMLLLTGDAFSSPVYKNVPQMLQTSRNRYGIVSRKNKDNLFSDSPLLQTSTSRAINSERSTVAMEVDV